jgi:hypothetical protein
LVTTTNWINARYVGIFGGFSSSSSSTNHSYTINLCCINKFMMKDQQNSD